MPVRTVAAVCLIGIPWLGRGGQIKPIFEKKKKEPLLSFETGYGANMPLQRNAEALLFNHTWHRF